MNSFDEFRALRVRRFSEGDYFTFLGMFSSDQRFEPFITDVAPRVHGAKFWKLLRFVWEMEEVVTPNAREWVKLFSRGDPKREAFMTKKEHRLFEQMPGELNIFRGFSHPGGEKGFSWTLELKTAQFFADFSAGHRRRLFTHLAGDRPTVALGRVKKTDVFAYLIGRKEDEIIVINPNSVFDIKVRLLPGAVEGAHGRALQESWPESRWIEAARLAEYRARIGTGPSVMAG